MYASNPKNTNFVDLTFYGDRRLIDGQRIYCVNDDILEGLNNGSTVDIYINRM